MSAIRMMFAMRSVFFRESFSRLLQGDQGMRVDIMGGCTFADEVERTYQELRPDILVMDTKLYRGDSLQVMRDLLQSQKEARIIGVSESFKPDISESLQEMGAYGYLLRNDDIKIMKRIILDVYNGVRVIDRKYEGEGVLPSLRLSH